MLKKILLALFAVLLILVIVIASRPGNFHIERSRAIEAPPAAVFAQINDLHKWQQWSPWAKLDPAAKATFEGPSAGKGAIFHWAGNQEVGEGTMTLTESQPNEQVSYQLDFRKPFKGTSTAKMTLVPEGKGTRVTWSMEGKNNFVAKAVSLVMNCDQIVGDSFNKGLDNLSKVVTAEKPLP